MLNSSGSGSGSDWRSKCRQLLDIIWNNPDSEPFKEPVDTLENTDYLQIVSSPMDFRTVKEELIGGNYESQSQFIKDMRMIFSNSRKYNTNPRSRVSQCIFWYSRSKQIHLKKLIG